MDDRIKLKISDNANKKDSQLSDFTINYSGKKMDNLQVSYEILSALKGDRDIFIELNSSLIYLEDQNKKSFLERFTGHLDKMGLEYKNKKIMVNSRHTILSISLNSKQVEGFDLFARIPDKIWNDSEFRSIIPVFGVRYYIPEKDSEIDVNTFAGLSEEERHDLCSMVIFDYILLGSMGINTLRLTKHDIDVLLNKS